VAFNIAVHCDIPRVLHMRYTTCATHAIYHVCYTCDIPRVLHMRYTTCATHAIYHVCYTCDIPRVLHMQGHAACSSAADGGRARTLASTSWLCAQSWARRYALLQHYCVNNNNETKKYTGSELHSPLSRTRTNLRPNTYEVGWRNYYRSSRMWLSLFCYSRIWIVVVWLS